MANLLRHHGVSMSENMAFGLSGALSFAYLPFIRISGQPLISYRMPPKAIIKGMMKPLRARFRFETFADAAAGERRLNELLDQGKLVGMQTSVFWLPYFPPDMRFHFNAHNLLVYGRDGGDYLVSDPVFEHPVRCAAPDLARARFARGVLAPKGLLYYPQSVDCKEVRPEALRQAIRTTARRMLAPVPIVGVRGMRRLAARLEKLPAAEPASLEFIGHIVRMQEEIGTGGAGFRFLYAGFLQEAAHIMQLPQLMVFAERLTAIGDDWRRLALAAARMVKGRDAPDPPALARRLRAQADAEASFFRELRAAV